MFTKKNILGVCSVAASILAFPYFKAAYRHRIELSEQYPSCFPHSATSEIPYFLGCLLVIGLLKHLTITYSRKFFESKASEKKKKEYEGKPEEFKLFLDKMSGSSFKAIHYTIVSALFMLGLTDYKSMPAMFGGSATTEEFILFENYPCFPINEVLHFVLIYQCAYFLHEAVVQIYWYADREDTPEYVLHHIVTRSMCWVGYQLNYIGFGGVIGFLTSISDIFVSLMRIVYFLDDAKYHIIVYLVMVSTFMLCRLYHIPKMMLHYQSEIGDNPHASPYLKELYPFFQVNVSFLTLLNILWTYFMLRAIVNKYVINKKVDKKAQKYV